MAFRSFAVPADPPKIIFDTDIARVAADGTSASDIDDLGALTILNALAAQGYCEILAVVTSTRSDTVVGMIDVVNTTFGHPDVPIGIKGGNHHLIIDQDSYARLVTAKFAHDQTSASAPAATWLLRKILTAASETDTIIYVHADTIAHWEYLCFDTLWESPADAISDLPGSDLVDAKIDEIVSYTPCLPNGGVSENCPDWTNVESSQPSALENWLKAFTGTVTGNTAAPAEAHVPTKLRETSQTDPVTMAYVHYYTQTPPPWRDTAEVPDAVSLYGDPLGVFFTVMDRFGNAPETVTRTKGGFSILADRKLRWDQNLTTSQHRYFHSAPDKQGQLLSRLAALFEFRP